MGSGTRHEGFGGPRRPDGSPLLSRDARDFAENHGDTDLTAALEELARQDVQRWHRGVSVAIPDEPLDAEGDEIYDTRDVTHGDNVP